MRRTDPISIDKIHIPDTPRFIPYQESIQIRIDDAWNIEIYSSKHFPGLYRYVIWNQVTLMRTGTVSSTKAAVEPCVRYINMSRSL